jgi:hypothetical protein
LFQVFHFIVERNHGVLARTIRSYIRFIRPSLPPTPPASQADEKKLRRRIRHYRKESVLHLFEKASFAHTRTRYGVAGLHDLIITPTDVWVGT